MLSTPRKYVHSKVMNLVNGIFVSLNLSTGGIGSNAKSSSPTVENLVEELHTLSLDSQSSHSISDLISIADENEVSNNAMEPALPYEQPSIDLENVTICFNVVFLHCCYFKILFPFKKSTLNFTSILKITCSRRFKTLNLSIV